jgi:fructose-bisphosphate aldolase class 1
MENFFKIIQSIFYIVAGIVAILTYRSAKNGLLNSVNTEYHKRVFDKLDKLSEILISEFDFESEQHWIKKKGLEKSLKEAHNIFKKNKKLILKNKKFSAGIPINETAEFLSNFVDKIKTDPFIPKIVRDKVVLHLENRANTINEIHITEIRKYFDELAKQKISSLDLDRNSSIVHNRINRKLYENNCGISQVEEQVHQIRLFIQEYLESFNPLKKK